MTSHGITPEFEIGAGKFYRRVLSVLVESKLPFLIGGTYAVKFYTGIDRPTKDIDIFCKATDYPMLLKRLSDAGLHVSIEDERWLARAYDQQYFADIIFGSYITTWAITDRWLDQAKAGMALGHPVKYIPPEELIVSKAYRLSRDAYDGADVVNLILKCGQEIDWKNLINRMEPNWEILWMHIVLYRFVYPSERDMIPEWVMTEMLKRLQLQLELPKPKDKVCRGMLVAPHDFKVAIDQWGFKDVTVYTFPRA